MRNHAHAVALAVFAVHATGAPLLVQEQPISYVSSG
jgi:hypothetical protein